MPRARDSEDETSDSSVIRRLRNTANVTNSPVRRSSRIKQSRETSPIQLRSSRNVRASSECSSPVPQRTTRRTRASSVDPDDTPTASPIRTRRRLSVFTATPTVKEETDESDAEKLTKRKSRYTRRSHKVIDSDEEIEEKEIQAEVLKQEDSTKKTEKSNYSSDKVTDENRDFTNIPKISIREKAVVVLKKLDAFTSYTKNKTSQKSGTIISENNGCIEDDLENNNSSNESDDIESIILSSSSESLSQKLDNSTHANLSQKQKTAYINDKELKGNSNESDTEAKNDATAKKLPISDIGDSNEIIKLVKQDTDVIVIIDDDDDEVTETRDINNHTNKSKDSSLTDFNSSIIDKHLIARDHVEPLNLNDSCTVTGLEEEAKDDDQLENSNSKIPQQKAAESDKQVVSKPTTPEKAQTDDTNSKTSAMNDPVDQEEDIVEIHNDETESMKLVLEEKTSQEREIINEVSEVDTPAQEVEKKIESRRKSVSFLEPVLNKSHDETESDDDFEKRVVSFFAKRGIQNVTADESLAITDSVVEPMEVDEVPTPQKNTSLDKNEILNESVNKENKNLNTSTKVDDEQSTVEKNIEEQFDGKNNELLDKNPKEMSDTETVEKDMNISNKENSDSKEYSEESNTEVSSSPENLVNKSQPLENDTNKEKDNLNESIKSIQFSQSSANTSVLNHLDISKTNIDVVTNANKSRKSKSLNKNNETNECPENKTVLEDSEDLDSKEYSEESNTEVSSSPENLVNKSQPLENDTNKEKDNLNESIKSIQFSQSSANTSVLDHLDISETNIDVVTNTNKSRKSKSLNKNNETNEYRANKTVLEDSEDLESDEDSEQELFDRPNKKDADRKSLPKSIIMTDKKSLSKEDSGRKSFTVEETSADKMILKQKRRSSVTFINETETDSEDIERTNANISLNKSQQQTVTAESNEFSIHESDKINDSPVATQSLNQSDIEKLEQPTSVENEEESPIITRRSKLNMSKKNEVSFMEEDSFIDENNESLLNKRKKNENSFNDEGSTVNRTSHNKNKTGENSTEEDNKQLKSHKSLNQSQNERVELTQSFSKVSNNDVEEISEDHEEEESEDQSDIYNQFIDAVKNAKVLSQSDDESASINEEDLDKSSEEKTEESEQDQMKTENSLSNASLENESPKAYNSDDKTTKVKNNIKSNYKSLEKKQKKKGNESVNKSATEIPNFLFSEGSNSDDEDEETEINSDIVKEYNLDGETVCEYPDDNVPGDDIRASETESSEDEEDESDIGSFIVDDDESLQEEEEEEGKELDEEKEDQIVELEDEEEESELGEEKENNTVEFENEEAGNNLDEEEKDKTEELEDTEVEEGTILRKKDRSRNSSLGKSNKRRKSITMNGTVYLDSEDDCQAAEYDESCIIIEEKGKLSKIKKAVNKNIMMSTPKSELPTKTSRRSKIFANISALNNSLPTENVEMNESQKSKSRKSLHRSLPIMDDTALKESPQKVKSSLSKTLLPKESESPTIKYLRKEKMNDTEPALKLMNNSVANKSNKKVENKKSKSLQESTASPKNIHLKSKMQKKEDKNSANIEVSTEKKKKSLTEIITEILENSEMENESQQNPVEVSNSERKKKKKKKKQTKLDVTEKMTNELQLKENKNKKDTNAKVIEEPDMIKNKKAKKSKQQNIEKSNVVKEDKKPKQKAMIQKPKIVEDKPKKIKHIKSKEVLIKHKDTKPNSNAEIGKDIKSKSKAKNLLEVPTKSLKRRSDEFSASFTEPQVKKRQRTNDDFLASRSGSTTHFEVVSLEKKKTKDILKVPAKSLKRQSEEFSSSFTEPHVTKRRKTNNDFIASRSGSTTNFEVVSLKNKKAKIMNTILNYRQRLLSQNSENNSAFYIYQQYIRPKRK